MVGLGDIITDHGEATELVNQTKVKANAKMLKQVELKLGEDQFKH